MERIETANYIARAQRVYRKDSAEYAMLSVEATSPDDALEAISHPGGVHRPGTHPA